MSVATDIVDQQRSEADRGHEETGIEHDSEPKDSERRIEHGPKSEQRRNCAGPETSGDKRHS